MTIPLPSVILASFIEKAPKRDQYFAVLHEIDFGFFKIAYWLHYE